MEYFDPRGGSNRYKVNVDFFKKWSDEMAYVLGLLYSDGNITDAVSSRTQYIQFNSKDRDTIEQIKILLGSEHPLRLIPSHNVSHADGKIYRSVDAFQLRIGSKMMFTDLKKLGLTTRKSITIDFPAMPKKYLRHFLRGYFDGDGCIYLQKGRSKTKEVIVKKLSIILTSGSKNFLEKLSKKIKGLLDLNHDKVYDSKRSYQVRYSIEDSIKLFKFFYGGIKYGEYMARKFQTFENYFSISPNRIDKDVAKILRIKNGLVPK